MDRSVAQEDYGVKPPEYWRVSLPSNELDFVMWGASGVPPPPAPPPKAVSPKRTISNVQTASANDIEIQDNILSALEISRSNEKNTTPASDKILLEDIVWKQRSGFGRYSLGFLHHEWEQRRLVLCESGILKYYALEKEAVVYDPLHSTDPKKSPWVYNIHQEPRGQIDLKPPKKGITNDSDNIVAGDSISHASSFEEGMRRLTSFVPGKEKGLNTGGVTVQARSERQGNPGPTPFEVEITRNDNNQMWRFCFECQAVQIEWLSMLNCMASDGAEEPILEENAEVTEGLGNHGFQPGDHIIRWEILPVLYPIQIHGIVLEAGKNCVIIADFGLASYNNHDHNGLTTHLEDEAKDDKHDAIMAAWEKIKPKEKKRLNVIAVTDAKDIRKWSKINYGSRVGDKEKKSNFFSLIPRRSKHNTKRGNSDAIDVAESNEDNVPSHKSSAQTIAESAEADGVGTSTQDYDTEQPGDDHAVDWEGEPDWIRPGFQLRKRTGSSSAPILLNKEGQSVFSIDKPDHPPERELPKSDSAKLVLSRTHFILEHEDLLPPYHVFYSNSECIAVWCKTGRWSTLQAAVYLVSSSVGFGKSATMLTITVAAAHAVLVPALAVGGLAVVGAPLLFLKSAKEQWNLTTMDLTEKFWMQADPDVFVEAIEYWSGLAIHAKQSSRHEKK